MQKTILISFFLAFLLYSVDAGSVISVDERSYPLIFVVAQVDYTDLASSGVFTVYTATDVTATYRILSMTTTAGDGTDFAGGDRNLYIGSTSETRLTMSAASLGSAGTTSFTIGNGVLPAFGKNGLAETPENDDIIVQYSGGTTDYTSGSVVFNIVLVQTQA